MKNKLLIKELNRMGSLMGYDLNKTLTEQKIFNNLADDVVTAVKKLFGDGDSPLRGIVKPGPDGFPKLRISDELEKVGKEASDVIKELEELVNGNNFDFFNTGFKNLEEFMDSIIVGTRSAAYKKGLFRIFMADTDMVTKNAKNILSDNTVVADLVDEIDISPNINAIDDVSEYFFDVPFKELELPGHKDLVKQVNRGVNRVIKDEADKIAKLEKVSKQVKPKSGVLTGLLKLSKKTTKWLFYGLLGGYSIDSLIGYIKGDKGVFRANEEGKVEDAFTTSYYVKMTRGQSEQYKNKQLLEPLELQKTYVKMTRELARFDNDPDATAEIYGKDSDIKSIIQASQFTDYYNKKAAGNNLVKDMANAMSIEWAKGTMNQFIKDLAGDIDAGYVFDQISTLNIIIGEKAGELLTDEEVMGSIFTEMPEYPRMLEEGEGDAYQKWCSTMIPGQKIPMPYLEYLSDWCSNNPAKCGGITVPWEDKLKIIPVAVQNKLHKTACDGIACFEVAEGETEDGWPMCTGELARHIVEFDGEEFKQIVTLGLNTLRNNENDDE